MRAVKVALPDGSELLLRTYDESDVADGFTPGRVEVDLKSGRTWVPLGLLGGSFQVEEPVWSKEATRAWYERMAEEARCEQGPAA